MKTFERKGHEGVKFFVGPEIEQTTAFGKKTLFVVGLQDTTLVENLAKEHGVKHIFLSANRSFDSVDMVNGQYMVGDTLATDWEKQIQHLLDAGYMVSLDYPAHKHVMVLEILNKGIWQSRNFIPILSVPVPHVNTSSINLTIKIDDVNFAATNPGVWCLNHQEVTDSNRFTGWAEYSDDIVLEIETLAPVNKNQTPVINDAEIGLDLVIKSALKPETKEEKAVSIPAFVSPDEAAEAYAEGTTQDPLSSKTPAKKVAKPKDVK